MIFDTKLALLFLIGTLTGASARTECINQCGGIAAAYENNDKLYRCANEDKICNSYVVSVFSQVRVFPNVCNGILLTPKIVLTAASCISAGANGQTTSPDSTKVSTAYINSTTAGPKVYDVDKMISHESYVAGSSVNDLALIFLKKEIPNVDTVKLYAGNPADNAIARIFGYTRQGETRAVGFTSLGLSLIPEDERCVANSYEWKPKENKLICTSSNMATAACIFNQGAPLVTVNPSRRL
ncbi:hypothetical protein BB560_003736, partial [Smittium megazygosporum]